MLDEYFKDRMQDKPSSRTVLRWRKKYIDSGVKEVILLGQNVNGYHGENKANKPVDLAYLMNVIAEFDEVKRIRYMTSHPKDVTEDLVQAHRFCEKLMPILHLPVQSGSTKILNAMNRGHNVFEYYEIIKKLKKIKPDIRFSSDFIIGYPGETDEDFNQTLNLIKKVEFINSYSFIYSARPGTPASNLDDIDPIVSKKRLIQLQSMIEKNNSEYKKSFLKKSTEVLFENRLNKQNKYFGRDKFLNSVIVECKDDLTSKILDVTINDFNHNSLFGVLSTNEKNFFAA